MNSSLRPGPTPHPPMSLHEHGFLQTSISQRAAPISLSPYPAVESGSTGMPSVREREERILYESLYYSWDFQGHRTSTPDKNEPNSLIVGREACISGTLRGKLQGSVGRGGQGTRVMHRMWLHAYQLRRCNRFNRNRLFCHTHSSYSASCDLAFPSTLTLVHTQMLCECRWVSVV